MSLFKEPKKVEVPMSVQQGLTPVWFKIGATAILIIVAGGLAWAIWGAS